MEKELPKGWVETDLDTVIERMSNGSSLKQHEEYFEGSLPISRIETIAAETIDLERVKYVKADKKDIEKYQLLEGDILFSHINSDKHLGKTALFNIEHTVLHGINLLLLRSWKVINSDFLYLVLRDLRFSGRFIEVAQRSVNQSSINQKKLKAFKIPLPPRAAQDRIVVKVDALMAQHAAIQHAMERIPQLLKDFRQQVLTQAVTGKLTEEWRVGKELVEIDLLLLENEREKLKQDFAFQKGRKSYKHKKALNPDIDSRIKGLSALFDLPNTWSWVSLDQTVFNISDGPHFSPTYVSSDSGKRFISMRNVSFNKLDFCNCKYVSIEDHNEFVKRGKPEKGDILYTKGGTTGIPCVVNDDVDFSYWVHVALLKPIKSFVSSNYLMYSLASSLCHKQSQAFTHGVGNQDLGLTRMIHISFPIPSLKEQQEIVRRVESLFEKATAIEQRYEQLKSQIDTLPQAILHKAFKGELVEQMDSDGSASELLREIEEMRMEGKNKKR